MSRLLVVDDHPIFRQGLATLFASLGHDIIGEAAGAGEAVELARRLRPDIVLMDLGLPDGSGVEATARIVAERPGTRVVVITMFDDTGAVRAALRAGACGYVVKDAPPGELAAAVLAAEAGATVLGSGVAGRAGAAAFAVPAPDPFGLTGREAQVLDLITRGLANRQIAERLGISGKTVSNVVSTILTKTGAPDRTEAARRARQALG